MCQKSLKSLEVLWSFKYPEVYIVYFYQQENISHILSLIKHI